MGVPESDAVEAVCWYAQAARQSHAVAQPSLRWMLQNIPGLLNELTHRANDKNRNDYLAASALAYIYDKGIDNNGYKVVAANAELALHWKQRAAQCSEPIPAEWLPSCLLGSSSVQNKYPREWRPFDVFLVHTGAQKRDIVAPLKDHLEQQGFRCFFDMEMSPSDGSPTKYMRFGLETCRHAVVVLSQELLDKGAEAAPSQELSFALKRMEWLRSTNAGRSWQSLWVVLFYVKVNDYHRDTPKNPLPKLASKVVLREYPGVPYDSWPSLYKELAKDLNRHDVEQNAVANWRHFLERRWQVEDHPTADKLYE